MLEKLNKSLLWIRHIMFTLFDDLFMRFHNKVQWFVLIFEDNGVVQFAFLCHGKTAFFPIVPKFLSGVFIRVNSTKFTESYFRTLDLDHKQKFIVLAIFALPDLISNFLAKLLPSLSYMYPTKIFCQVTNYIRIEGVHSPFQQSFLFLSGSIYLKMHGWPGDEAKTGERRRRHS